MENLKRSFFVYVTYDVLVQIGLFLVALIALIYNITNNKK